MRHSCRYYWAIYYLYGKKENYYDQGSVIGHPIYCGEVDSWGKIQATYTSTNTSTNNQDINRMVPPFFDTVTFYTQSSTVSRKGVWGIYNLPAGVFGQRPPKYYLAEELRLINSYHHCSR